VVVGARCVPPTVLIVPWTKFPRIRRIDAKHPGDPRRLTLVHTHHYRPLAYAALWRGLLVAVAVTLILVLLPAALALAAAT